MGKVVKTVVGVATTVVGVVTGNPFLIKVGASVTLSGVSEIIAGDPKAPEMEDPGQRLTLTTDPAKSRDICYGKSATGGTLVFRDTVGTKNSDLWMVTAIAGHEITSIEEIKFGGVVTTFSSNNAVGTFNNKWFQYEHLGTDAQIADANLVAASSKWTTDHRARGVAYAVNKFIYDQEVFQKGLEAVVYTIKGKKVYDPRKDSTNGGTGTHRFTDKTTWEWSENPVLCLVDYLRGEIQNAVTIWGMGQGIGNFDWANVIAEANICDEAVTLKAGGTEKRYTCNGFLDSENDHRENVRNILSSCAGTLVWQSGKWRVYVGVARTATYTRTQDHFITGLKYKPFKEYLGKANCIRGLYNDPEAGYQAKEYPPVSSATYVAQDGGQEIWTDLNLPMTKSKSTAQRLANIALNSIRMQKQISTTVHTIGLQDQVMDSVGVTYPNLNLNAKKMVVMDWALRFQKDDDGAVGLVVEETFLETDDSIYTWTAATDEATIPAPGTLNNPPPELLAWDDVTGANKPEDGATVGDPYGASFNLLGADAGTVVALQYFYHTLNPIDDFGWVVGDVISFSALLTSTNSDALDGRVIIDFFDGADALILRTNGSFLSGIFTDSLSKIEGLAIPANTVKVSVLVSGTTTTGVSARRAMLNRGPIALPYVAPYEDSATVGDPFGASFNLMGLNAGPEISGNYKYYDKALLSDLGLSPGDIVSWSGILRSTDAGALDHRIRVSFHTSSDVPLGSFDTNLLSGIYSEQVVSRENFTVPDTSAKITVESTWNTGASTQLFAKRVILNRGPVALPYVAPYSDGADVTANNTSADTTLVSGTASATVKDGAVRANSAIAGSGLALNSGITQLEPTTGEPRRITNATSVVTGTNGQSFTFNPVRQEIPSIIVTGGGIGEPDPVGSVASERWWRNIGVKNVTTSGFDLVAEFQGLSASPSAQIDSVSTGDPPVIEKSLAEEAIDDTYEYQFDVTVNARLDLGGGEFEVSSLVVAFDTRTTSGGAWTERGEASFANFTTAAKSFVNQIKDIVVDGLGADAAWRIRVKSTAGNGGSISSFDKVTYNLTGGATLVNETATPGIGEKPITIFIAGGKEESVS